MQAHQLLLLYTDARSRLNTLHQEFAHVEQTAYAFMKKASADVLDPNHDPRGVREYENFGIREKQYQAVLVTAQQCQQAISANKREISEAFENAVLSVDNLPGGGTKAVFSFVCVRQAILEDGIKRYAEVLQHLHERIVQQLDTSPAAMPQPLLLRRWQSSLHEKFLSAYCRDLHHQAALSAAFLNVFEFDPLTDELRASAKMAHKNYEARAFSRWREYSMSHGWSHSETSTTIDLEFGAMSSGNPRRVGILKSIFFYLEQPILFPLLFHELAHFQIDRDYEEMVRGGGKPDRTVFGFACILVDITNALKLGLQRRGFDHQRSDIELFTKEVGADTLAITLGGVAYLQALVLQIFPGIGGHYSKTTPHPHNLGATHSTAFPRITPDDKHVPSMQYFAYARVQVALNVYRQTFMTGPAPELSAKEIVDSIEAILVLWAKSGAAVMNPETMSAEHDEWWDYYLRHNKWVADTCLERFNLPYTFDANTPTFFQRLHALRISGNSSLHQAKPEVAQTISRFVDAFCKANDLLALEGDGAIDAPSQVQESVINVLTRIESAPLSVRWALNERILPKIAISQKGGSAFRSLDSLVDHTRWDGLIAFRYCLEVHQLFLSGIDAEGERLLKADPRDFRHLIREFSAACPSIIEIFNREDSCSDGRRVTQFLGDLFKHRFSAVFGNTHLEPWGALAQMESDKTTASVYRKLSTSTRTRDDLSRFLEDLLVTPSDDTRLSFSPIRDLVELKFLRTLDSLGGNCEPPVFSLRLGCLRPSKDSGGEKKSFIQSLCALRKDQPGKSVMLPALGDYTYVVLEQGVSPTTLPCPRAGDGFQDRPRHFEKARTLIQLSASTGFVGDRLVEFLNRDTPPGNVQIARVHGDHNAADSQVSVDERRCFFRLSLIKFKRRERALALAKKLVDTNGKDPTFEYSLFLSSGWEDCVLLTRHPSLTELEFRHDSLREFLEVKSNEIDIQSMILLDGCEINDNQKGEFGVAPQAKNHGASTLSQIVNSLRHTATEIGLDPELGFLMFGRYDASLRWRSSCPYKIFDIVKRLDVDSWHGISHISHSVMFEIHDISVTDEPTKSTSVQVHGPETKKFNFVTRVDLSIH